MRGWNVDTEELVIYVCSTVHVLQNININTEICSYNKTTMHGHLNVKMKYVLVHTVRQNQISGKFIYFLDVQFSTRTFIDTWTDPMVQSVEY